MSDIGLSYVRGGADGIAPSSMLNGIVNSARMKLDSHNFKHIPIMSYSTKFASNFYGPFRAAADSSPSFGDRTSYQLDYTDKENAIKSSIKFSDEGADLLMVKPGLLSLDLIEPIALKTKKPIGAYQVSGEYSSLVYLADNKLIDFDSGLLETWSSFKRAGAQYIISYGSRYAKRLGI
jgi:porphobilinogen synthase|tara:strand:- start:674 stop:1207 length:534 start_codon:yes stop_codon:yes gene_type:complete